MFNCVERSCEYPPLNLLQITAYAGFVMALLRKDKLPQQPWAA